MNLDIIIKIATLLSIIMGLIAFFRGITTYNKQMNAQVFFQYAKRYDEIMNSFPGSARIARIKSNEALPKPSAELTICVLRYFNLCSEEFYLYEEKYMSKKVWNVWRDEMIRTWRTPLFQREWKKIVHEFDTYPKFQSFVKKIQENEAISREITVQ
jgi:hypothetical protein